MLLKFYNQKSRYNKHQNHIMLDFYEYFENELDKLRKSMLMESEYDYNISEIENIRRTCENVEKQMLIKVYIYKNSKDENVYLRYPEILTVSDYQGYRYHDVIEMKYNPDTLMYEQPYSFFKLEMFDDIYHSVAYLPQGIYKVKIRQRKMFKHDSKRKRKMFCGKQYCFEPSNIKRQSVKGYSKYGPWEWTLCIRYVTDDNKSHYFINEKQIFPVDIY